MIVGHAYEICRTATYGAASGGMAFVVGVAHGRLRAVVDARSPEEAVMRERRRYEVARSAFRGLVRRGMRASHERAEATVVDAGFPRYPQGA